MRLRCYSYIFLLSSVLAFANKKETDLHLDAPKEKTAFSLQLSIESAIKYHPSLAAKRHDEIAKKHKVTEATSEFFPHINGDGVIGKGFPGAGNTLGLEGIAGSPFHKGATASVVLTQTIWDFGRTLHGREVAQENVALTKIDAKILQISIAQKTIESYYLCARYRSLSDIFSGLLQDALKIEKEVDKFVKSSQVSIVDGYLAKSQTKEIQTLLEDAQKGAEIELSRLALMTNKNAEKMQCPFVNKDLMAEFEKSSLSVALKDIDIEKSPYVEQAKIKVKISQTEKKRAFDEHLPRIVGAASVGYLQDVYASVPKDHWSVSLGIKVPVFEGLKVKAEVDAATENILAQQHELSGVLLNLREANTKYDRLIESSRLRIKNLKEERQVAQKGFSVAKERYYSFQGQLVDLREALRNLSRVELELVAAEHSFLFSSAEKSILNGAL